MFRASVNSTVNLSAASRTVQNHAGRDAGERSAEMTGSHANSFCPFSAHLARDVCDNHRQLYGQIRSDLSLWAGSGISYELTGAAWEYMLNRRGSPPQTPPALHALLLVKDNRLSFAIDPRVDASLPTWGLNRQERDGSVVPQNNCIPPKSSTMRRTCIHTRTKGAVPLPIISPAKRPNDDLDILAPSGLYWQQGIAELFESTRNLDQEMPWENKVQRNTCFDPAWRAQPEIPRITSFVLFCFGIEQIQKAFWRGTSYCSGHPFKFTRSKPDGLRDGCARTLYSYLSQQNSTILDIGLVNDYE
eukprot:scaffold169141_cov41-Prasinocladus_malaysianus.AAC.1